MSDLYKAISGLIGNKIEYFENLRTGEITADNGDGTYDVKIANADSAYPNVETLDYGATFSIREIVVIGFEYGNKESPKILGSAKKIAQEPKIVEVDYSGAVEILFESQLINDGSWMSAHGESWLAYFFQAESNHTIEKIQLYMTRTGLPGTVTVSIFPNEGSGNFKPVIGGGALTSGTTNGDTLHESDGEWREIEVTPYSLISGTWYSIVIKATGGDISNYVEWWGTNDDVKPDQWRHTTPDSGANWYSGAFDLTYKIYN